MRLCFGIRIFKGHGHGQSYRGGMTTLLAAYGYFQLVGQWAERQAQMGCRGAGIVLR